MPGMGSDVEAAEEEDRPAAAVAAAVVVHCLTACLVEMLLLQMVNINPCRMKFSDMSARWQKNPLSRWTTSMRRLARVWMPAPSQNTTDAGGWPAEASGQAPPCLPSVLDCDLRAAMPQPCEQEMASRLQELKIKMAVEAYEKRRPADTALLPVQALFRGGKRYTRPPGGWSRDRYVYIYTYIRT